MMNKKTLVIFVILIFAIAVGVGILFGIRSELVLEAKETVLIYKTKDDALSGDSGKKVAALADGEHVVIRDCVDVKHYQIYRVKFSDGRVGFVNDGKYVLLRDGKESGC